VSVDAFHLLVVPVQPFSSMDSLIDSEPGILLNAAADGTLDG
jgi:hypothetical protein